MPIGEPLDPLPLARRAYGEGVEDDDAAFGVVFLGIFTTIVVSGLVLVVVGEVVRRRGAGSGSWVTIGAGVALLLIPATALVFPGLVS